MVSLLTVISIYYFILDGSQFTLLFFSVFSGATVVTFNTRVLGGQISYFQSVSILGYCLFPLFLSTFLLQILRLVQFNSSLVRFIAISVSCLWCILGKYQLLYTQRQEHLYQLTFLRIESS